MRSAGDRYQRAMEIQTPSEADAYFAELVEEQMLSSGCSRAQAENVERANLAYFAGYYNDETRERVERLFACAHPIFGPIAKYPAPSPEQALAMGRVFGGAAPIQSPEPVPENVGVTCRKCGTSWITGNTTPVFTCMKCGASVRGPRLNVVQGQKSAKSKP